MARKKNQATKKEGARRSAPGWEAEEFLRVFRSRTGNAVTRNRLERYLREGLVFPPGKDGRFDETHLERLQMLEHLRSRYGMSMRDMAGIFGVLEGKREEPSREGAAERGDDRRRKIIANAARLFAGKGYHGTTVDEIVQATGIAKGTFYLYFESKEDLLVEVIKNLIDETLQRIDEKLRGKGRSDFITRIEAKGEELLGLYLENSELLYMLLGETVGNHRLQEQLHEVYERLAERLEEDLQWGVQEGEIFPYQDLRTVAYALVGMGQTVAILVSGSDREQLPRIRATVDQLIRRIFSR
ncbi:MAG: TetR family transcriptional regulator [Actinomycetota bacterium]|nr:TetR family transcriptional regulator [Actinomycetota bacterium]